MQAPPRTQPKCIVNVSASTTRHLWILLMYYPKTRPPQGILHLVLPSSSIPFCSVRCDGSRAVCCVRLLRHQYSDTLCIASSGALSCHPVKAVSNSLPTVLSDLEQNNNPLKLPEVYSSSALFCQTTVNVTFVCRLEFAGLWASPQTSGSDCGR